MHDLRTFALYLKPYRRHCVIGIVGILLSVGIGLLTPRIIRFAIDSLRKEISWWVLTRQALTILGVTCVSNVLLFLTRHVINELSRNVVFDLRQKLYAHVQQQPLTFFRTYRTSDLMVRLTDELESVRQLAGPVFQNSLQTLFALVIVIPLMLYISPRLTLLFFMTIPTAFLLVQYFRHKAQARIKKMQDLLVHLTGRVQENIIGVRVLRAYAQEEAEIAAFKELNRVYAERTLNMARTNAIMRPLMQLLIGTGMVLNIWYGGLLAVGGEITIGQFIEFNIYLVRLTAPLTSMGYTVKLYQRGRASLKGIVELLSIKPAISDGAEVQAQPAIVGGIEFRNLTFTYPSAKEPSLHDINLLIRPGQTVAFIGRTGAGKSTLMNFIPRILEAPPGSVLIDGVPVYDYPLAQLRQSIGYVRQDYTLFSETLAENIAFGVEAAERSDIERVVQVAGLSDDVSVFPEKLDTLVGERGITLSGGQQQRTAIARALLRSPPILILDNAFSSIDAYTEEKILAQLREVMRERTSLIVSHRVSTVREADFICVLEEGRIVERGTHDELLALEGEYAALYRRQLLQDELAAC